MSGRLSLLLAALCGAAFGLGLARTLFEWQPLPLSALASWPGTLLVAIATATLAATVVWHNPRLNAAHALPLALPLLHALAPNVDPLRGWTLLAGGLTLTALLAWLHPASSGTDTSSARSGHLLSLFLFLSLSVLYLRTLAPSVGEADTFEFQVGIARLGVAHGSGYPLLMLVGKVFSLLPLGGTLAWRANLTSAFFAALAAVLAQRLARRLGAGPLPAVLAGLLFGVSPTLWSRAVEVEAYTLNAAFVAALLYLAIDIADTGTTRRLPLAAFLFGLSLTNHLTTLLLAPCLAVAALTALLKEKEREKEKAGQKRLSSVVRRLSSALLAVILGLSVYLYLPLRWPAVNNGQRLSLAQFANIVTGNEAKGALQWDLPLRDPGRYSIVFAKLQSEFGWLGIAAVALGVGLPAYALLRRVISRRTNRPTNFTSLHVPLTNYQLLFLALAYAPFIYFGLAFNVPDPDFSAFFIPLHLVTAVFIGLGLQSLLVTGAKISRTFAPLTTNDYPIPSAHSPLSPVLLSAVCLLSLQSIWRTLPRVDQSNDWESYRLGERILAQPLAQGATILADSQKIAPLYYLQVAEGLRPDLDIVVLPDEASYRAVLDQRIAEGTTVYLGRYLPGLGGGYALKSVGPLAEVSPTAWTEQDMTLTLPRQAITVPGLALLGYSGLNGPALTATTAEGLALTLAWQVDTPIEENLLVGLQLVDGAGRLAWRGPGRVPVGGLYPTNAWHPGEVVTDYHALLLAAALAPGRYRLQVGLFPPFAVAEAGWTDVADITVAPPAEPARPPQPLRARIGDAWLLGYALPETAPPGTPVEVTLYWLRDRTPDQKVTAFGQERQLAAWPPGSLVPQVYQLQAPVQGDRLEVAISTGESAHCGWLTAIRASCALPAVRLAGQAAAKGARNFDHQLLLNSATLDTSQAATGGQVRVTLEWQGLRRMTEDYTVFVHLLGPDGRVHGQVDAWPVSGTRATSAWEPGQPIHDPYVIPVPVDAPPGTYQVEIGLYLLATGQRLPVLNEAGEVVEDRVILEGLVINGQ